MSLGQRVSEGRKERGQEKDLIGLSAMASERLEDEGRNHKEICCSSIWTRLATSKIASFVLSLCLQRTLLGRVLGLGDAQ